jgi:hypothetical protein
VAGVGRGRGKEESRAHHGLLCRRRRGRDDVVELRWLALPVASRRSGGMAWATSSLGRSSGAGGRRQRALGAMVMAVRGSSSRGLQWRGRRRSGSREEETRRTFVGGRVETWFAHINSTMWSRHGHSGGGDVRRRTAAARLAGRRWSARHGSCARGMWRKGIGPGWWCGVGQSHLAHVGERTPRRPGPASGARSGAVGVRRHGSAFRRDFHFGLALFDQVFLQIFELKCSNMFIPKF